MDESRYMNDFQIVAIAGTSRSNSLMALKEAKQGNYEKAEELLKAAEEAMNQAHELQFGMLQQECSGNPVDITIVTVHGQDHMTMAVCTYDLVKEMIDLIKEMRGVQ